MARMPSDAEIQAAAEELNLGPGPYDTRTRAKIVKTIQEAQRLEGVERTAERSAQEFGPAIAGVYKNLHYTQQLPSDVAGQITAAVAPLVYRDTTKETPHP